MLEVPPGIVYLVQHLPRVLAPPAFTFVIKYALQAFLDTEVPSWIFVLALVLSFPVAISISIAFRDYINQRDAAKLGAVLPPTLEDKWPGGLSTLAEMSRNTESRYIGELNDKRCKELGNTFIMNVMFERRVFTSEPEYIKAILATQFDAFEKGPVFKAQADPLLGTGVFNSDGEMWKFHRAMTRPFFTKDRISHFDIFERHADDAIAQLKTRFKEGYPVDIQDVVSRFTLDSATEFLFGSDVRSLSAGLPYPEASSAYPNSPSRLNNSSHPANQFAHAFAAAQSATALRSRWGFNWPLTEFWHDKCKEHMRVVEAYINPILAEAIAKKRAEGGEKLEKGDREVKDGETLLDHLVNYTEDMTILKDETLNIMIAGRDTTAATLTFAFYMLAENPEVMRRLREEILSKVGSSRRPTYEDLRDMKYLRAVINETLRLYPPVPFNSRTTTKPTLWPSTTPGGKPFYLPAHTKAPYSVFMMHRRTDLWGPDALVFDPDRFLDERLHKYLTPNPFIFLPFNAGPRICLGQQFAYNETSFMIVRLLQSFSSVTLTPDAQPPSSRPPSSWAKSSGRQAVEKIIPKSHLTLYAKQGVWLKMEEASPVETV